MRVIINGAVCDLREQTAIGILYPDFAWCKTLTQARMEQEASKSCGTSRIMTSFPMCISPYTAFVHVG